MYEIQINNTKDLKILKESSISEESSSYNEDVKKQALEVIDRIFKTQGVCPEDSIEFEEEDEGEYEYEETVKINEVLYCLQWVLYIERSWDRPYSMTCVGRTLTNLFKEP